MNQPPFPNLWNHQSSFRQIRGKILGMDVNRGRTILFVPVVNELFDE
jgi:hypothetical protein